MQELIAHLKARPGAINIATPGNGSSQHLATELFKSMARAQIAGEPQGSFGGDGLTVDADGRLYVTGGAGVYVFDRSGRQLGVIPTPRRSITASFRSRLPVMGILSIIAATVSLAAGSTICLASSRPMPE